MMSSPTSSVQYSSECDVILPFVQQGWVARYLCCHIALLYAIYMLTAPTNIGDSKPTGDKVPSWLEILYSRVCRACSSARVHQVWCCARAVVMTSGYCPRLCANCMLLDRFKPNFQELATYFLSISLCCSGMLCHRTPDIHRRCLGS
jgi:hypothetical protein